MSENKKKGLGLPQTRGEFQIKGIITGTDKESFLEFGTTQKGSPMAKVKFGVKTSNEARTTVTLKGYERENVYFYKRPEKQGEKGVTRAIPWNKRDDFNEDGFNLIGINMGLEKEVDDSGKEKNKRVTMVEYDACDYIGGNLNDEQSVFIKGSVDYSSFKTDEGDVIRMTEFSPKQISLCSKPIDFDEEDYEELSAFQQVIIFMSMEEDQLEDGTKRGLVQARIVNYNSIENAEFVIYDKKLFSAFKKNLKPYTAIKVWGDISNRVEKAEVTETDCWGEENVFDKVNDKFKRELVITGADKNSIDTKTYSEEKVESAIKAKKEFGEESKPTNEDESWGSDSNLDDNNEETWD